MKLMCIDPGPKTSGMVLLECYSWDIPRVEVIEPEIDNEDLLCDIYSSYGACEQLAIEMVACYGMAVGESVFQTCLWVGRFAEAFNERHGGGKFSLVYRKDVKINLCQSMRAKDGNIRQALLDKYPSTGGGKTPQIGTKAQPGPLYGIKKHAWAALAVGHTWVDTIGITGTGDPSS